MRHLICRGGLLLVTAAAEQGAQTTDDDADHPQDDQPHAFVGRRAGNYFLGTGSNGIMGVDSVGQQDDADDENRDGGSFVHNIGREFRLDDLVSVAGSVAANHPGKNHDQCNYEQHMNESAQGVRRHEAEEPEHDKDDSEGFEHGDLVPAMNLHWPCHGFLLFGNL